MGYRISLEKMDCIMARMQEKYKIYGPKRMKNREGTGHDEIIRYGEISSVSEIVFDKPSDFSPKEVFYPIVETLYYINEYEFEESRLEENKDYIIFARPCDINGIKRLDTIFLKNGGQADNFYHRRREKVKIFMMECQQGWEDCFCVSMGTNYTDEYSAAFRFDGEGLLAEVKDESFEAYFHGEDMADFIAKYVSENTKKVRLPGINESIPKHKVHELEFWKGYDDICVGCGRCNTVCITCSCFDTRDVIYDETSRSGERRRVWSACMLKAFTLVAGGRGVRQKVSERMRFKTLHKIYDFNFRFGEGQMCVGCGRCDRQCPQDIRFSDVINTLSEEVEKMVSEESFTMQEESK